MGVYIILKRHKKKRSHWVHEINEKRSTSDKYHILFQDLLRDDERFHINFRATKTQFEEIHEFIGNYIYKKSATFREAFSTKERLAICLRYVLKRINHNYIIISQKSP